MTGLSELLRCTGTLQHGDRDCLLIVVLVAIKVLLHNKRLESMQAFEHTSGNQQKMPAQLKGHPSLQHFWSALQQGSFDNRKGYFEK